MSQKAKTDLVMALWFCEIAAKRILGRNRKNKITHRDNPFAQRSRVQNRRVVNLADIRRQKFEEQLGVASG